MALPAALLFAGASSSLDLLGGLFGYFAGKEASRAAESRARMVRLEADADAQRYSEQARGFKATQKLAFLKSGVQLSGSPLDILDETARVASENISAIRARGEAGAQDFKLQAAQARIQGRNALIGGISNSFSKLGWAFFSSGQTSALGTLGNNTLAG